MQKMWETIVYDHYALGERWNFFVEQTKSNQFQLIRMILKKFHRRSYNIVHERAIFLSFLSILWFLNQSSLLLCWTIFYVIVWSFSSFQLLNCTHKMRVSQRDVHSTKFHPLVTIVRHTIPPGQLFGMKPII